MADVEKRVALGGQPPHMPKQDRHFRGQQRRGRFVQDYDPRIAADRLGYRDHGVLIRPEPADFGPRVDLESDAIKQLRRALLDDRPVDEEPDATRQGLGKEQIFRHRQLRHQIEMLMDDGDAKVLRLLGRVQFDRPPFDVDLPLGLAGGVHDRDAGTEAELHRLTR